jgi:hypothetical protein
MSITRTPTRIALLLLPAAIVMAAPQAPAAPEDETYQGEAPERYAMVRALEGEVIVFKGEVQEALTRGTPIGEGDVVESRGRGVLQLGDGTRIAFGSATRFTVAALFTDKKGERQVLLRLDYGRVRVLLGGQSDARLRVDTPSGSASVFDKGSFSLEAERDRTVRLKVHTGRVTFANERNETRVAAGDRLTVYSPQDGLDRVRSFNTYDGDDFDRWCDRAMAVRQGESWQRVPSEIRYYADDLDQSGHWINSPEFGWVWQPNGVAEDWRPYYRGRWAPYAGGMTWISDEPWAYVAYHHGRWHWAAGAGWFWIPGIYYSPAWVAWNHSPGYAGWAPLGYHNEPCHWGYGAWGGGYAWNVVAVGHLNFGNIHTRITINTGLLRTFNGGRDLHAPWQRSPLIVSRAEFHSGHVDTAFRPEVHRERLGAYERQAQVATGRVIVRRELRPAGPAEVRPGGPAPGPSRAPFEERRTKSMEGLTPKERPRDLTPSRIETSPRERMPESRPRAEERRPETLPRERMPESRPKAEERRPETSPRERMPESRPKAEERRPETSPRERMPESRPKAEERRPETSPRERMPESRPKAEERRPETSPRERMPESRPRSEERRPEAAPKPEAKPHEAPPKHEVPKEKPREERH